MLQFIENWRRKLTIKSIRKNFASFGYALHEFSDKEVEMAFYKMGSELLPATSVTVSEAAKGLLELAKVGANPFLNTLKIIKRVDLARKILGTETALGGTSLDIIHPWLSDKECGVLSTTTAYSFTQLRSKFPTLRSAYLSGEVSEADYEKEML